MNVTVERLRSLLKYDAESGIITRQGKPVGTVNVGGYLVIRVDRKVLYAHRIAWALQTGQWPVGKVDHKNCIRTDIRWANLRIASDAQNAHNSRRRVGASGIKGVYWNPRRSKWTAKVVVGGRQVVKEHRTIFDAACSVFRMRELFHGEFANHQSLEAA